MQIFDRRPIIVALAGPNGAGKTTFYRTFLSDCGLYFVNADVIAEELNVDPYHASRLAGAFRNQLIEQKVSFVFETVFSDPVGDKLSFLKQAETLGYTVVLLFIGIGSPVVSDQRVAMRVSKGGHDVPQGKLLERYPRVMQNLQRALVELSNVRVYDNDDLLNSYRPVAVREDGGDLEIFEPIPAWLLPLMPVQ